MGFLSRLFGNTAAAHDATKDWPPATGPSPQMNVDRRALEAFGGSVTLGDRIDAARVLGRPDTVEASGAWTTLRYETWGLVLEFEERDDPLTACPRYVDEMRRAFTLSRG